MSHPRGRAHHHSVVSYPVTLLERVWTFALGPLLLMACLYALCALYPALSPQGHTLALFTVIEAAGATLARLVVAYCFALTCAVPLAILVTHSERAEKILLPLFDIFQSVPVLALFPIIILFFVQFNFLNGAAVFILFLTMLWNIVFTLVGGINVIPKDVLAAARIFGLSGFSLIKRVVVPAIVPQLVTGSLLAFAQGWNIIIVAEVLHTYIPGGTAAQDLFGVGSILVDAASRGDNGALLMAVSVMVVLIALINFFIWQKLLHFAQRFRFD